jgi:hypothetical protein
MKLLEAAGIALTTAKNVRGTPIELLLLRCLLLLLLLLLLEGPLIIAGGLFIVINMLNFISR